MLGWGRPAASAAALADPRRPRISRRVYADMALLYYAKGKEAATMPALNGVKETCLHVEDLARSRRFYESVMGFTAVAWDEHFCAYDAGGQTMLLLFVRGMSGSPKVLPGGVIPPHDGGGRLHVGFAIPVEE